MPTRMGDVERGRLHPPYPSGALQERYARKGGGDQVVGAWADYDIRLTRLHARPWVGYIRVVCGRGRSRAPVPL